MKRKSLIFTTILLVSIIFTEVYLRKIFYEQLKDQSFPLIYEPDSLGGYKYIPFAKNVHIAPSYNVVSQTINSHGYFGHDFNIKKGNDTFRIAFVSNSYNSGGDISKHIDKKIKKENKKIEIINCSIDGAAQFIHMYKRIKFEIPKYNADLILFEVLIPFKREDYTRECYRNYVMEYKPNSEKSKNYCKERIDKIYKYRFLTFLYDKSFIIRAICKKMVDKYEYKYGTFTQQYIAPYRRKKILSDDRLTYIYTVEKTIKELDSLNVFLKKKNIKLVIFNYFQDYNTEWKKNELSKYGVEYFNLDVSLDYYYKELRLQYDGHPSEKGNIHFANLLYSNLIIEKYIPKKYN